MPCKLEDLSKGVTLKVRKFKAKKEHKSSTIPGRWKQSSSYNSKEQRIYEVLVFLVIKEQVGLIILKELRTRLVQKFREG